MRISRRSSLSRCVRLALLGHLAGGCVFAASCGDQIRRGFLNGVQNFVTGTTTQLVSQSAIEQVLLDLLTADSNSNMQNTFPVN